MKRIFILFGVLAMAIGAQAQYNQKSNYISFNVNGGFNTMMFKPTDGSYLPLYGFGSGLRYTHFFGRHFGIGFGAQYYNSLSVAIYDYAEVTNFPSHPDNDHVSYDLHTTYNDWYEKQNLSYLTVPLEFYWRAPMGERWFFLFGLGAEFVLPLHGEYEPYNGTYKTEGYFPSTGHMISDMPEHGFRTYNAEDVEGSEFTVAEWGVNVIADLGFNYSLSNHWGLYFGIYGGFGVTNMLDSTSKEPLAVINEDDASKLDYNGTFASNQIDAMRLLNVGLKLGVNFGWNCHSGSKADKDSDLVSYDDQKAAKDKDKKDSKKDDSNKQQNEQPATNESNQPAADQQPTATSAYGNNGADDAEAKAAEEARCNARRMNDPDMAQAMANIDADINDAEAMANETGNAEAKNAIADARAKAADAKKAHKNGQYCKAYDLFNEAYGSIADSYAKDAETFAGKNNTPESKQAADDAALYAEASHKDGLDCAMAASRNARLNSEIARNANGGRGNNSAYLDPNYADYLANEAMAMANDANSADGKTDAKDASGKAYRGQLAPCYAACAKSFAESADAYAAKCSNAEAKAAAKEANAKAAEAAEASRMGDVAGAYRAARAAQQAAERARSVCGGDSSNTAKQPAAKPADRSQLQKYLDQINATVHFDFAQTEPKFDSKTDLAITALVAAMKADKNVKILITGHTDNVGSADGNMAYGKKRAEALKQLMVNRGAPAASISTASKGENEPVAENDTEEHRYQNRRAVITLR